MNFYKARLLGTFRVFNTASDVAFFTLGSISTCVFRSQIMDSKKQLVDFKVNYLLVRNLRSWSAIQMHSIKITLQMQLAFVS
jgi:uncharacterized protein YaeQ